MKYSDCPDFLKDFLFFLETIKGNSKKTVDGYYIDLRTFFRFLISYKNNSKIGDIKNINIDTINLEFVEQITLSNVYEYLHYISNSRNNNAITRARKISSIRALFNYLHIKVKLIKDNPVKDLSIPSSKKSLPKYLTLEQSIEMLQKASQNFSKRDFCIITLFLNCGMRLSELVSINTYDIKNNNLKLLGKGNKERVIYLNEVCTLAIDSYRNERDKMVNIRDKNALFLSKQGKRISNRRVQQIVEDILRECNLDNEGFSPHKLRHTAATLMYQHGNVDIRILKEILGHENIATTEIYTHVSNKQLEDALKNSPLNKKI